MPSYPLNTGLHMSEPSSRSSRTSFRSCARVARELWELKELEANSYVLYPTGRGASAQAHFARRLCAVCGGLLHLEK